jgi:hypothetical protein
MGFSCKKKSRILAGSKTDYYLSIAVKIKDIKNNAVITALFL